MLFSSQVPKHKRAKNPPKEKNVDEKLELLGLQQVYVPAGLMVREAFWDVLDGCLIMLLSAVLTCVWQEVHVLAHPDSHTLGFGTLVLVSTASLALYGLVALVFAAGGRGGEGVCGLADLVDDGAQAGIPYNDL
jgi:hypothetical protein